MPRVLRTLLTVAAAAVMTNSLCDKKTVQTLGLPAIMGTVVRAAILGDTAATDAAVSVNGTRLLPVVTISNDTLRLDGYSCAGEYQWDSDWSESPVGFEPGTKCVLQVYQSDGTATGDSTVLAVDPQFSSPADSATLKKDSSLVISWTQPGGVDRYELYLDIWYRYNNYQDFYLEETLHFDASTSSYTLPAATLFPTQVDTVLNGHADIYLTAEAGPDVGRQTTCNIKGHGCGYFWTRNTVWRRVPIATHLRGRQPARLPELLSAASVLVRKQQELSARAAR